MKFHVVSSLVSCFSSFSLLAALPVVEDVAYSQDAEALMTVAYTLKDGPAVVTCDVLTNGVSIGQQFLTNMVGAVNRIVRADEPHVIRWDARATWPGMKVRKIGSVRVTAWPLDDPPDYMVVDLAETDRDTTNRFYECAEALPGGLTVTNGPYYANKMVFRHIRAKGVTWRMGSQETYGRTTDGAENVHLVTLTNDYYMAVFEPTVRQWKLCSSVIPPDSHDGTIKVDMTRDELPIHHVSFDNVRGKNKPWPLTPGGWIGTARTRTGIDFDLPSEAQWEFACRSGVDDYVWNTGVPMVVSGSSYTAVDAGCPGTYNNARPSTFVSVAGTYPPNKWGLYDMHGNVSEACIDWWETDITSFGGRPNVDLSDPTKTLSGATGSEHPCRGGCYQSPLANCVPSHRSGDHTHSGPSEGHYGFNGFRVIAPALAK